MNVKRYSLELSGPYYNVEAEMKEAADGEYVLYEDYAAALKNAARYRWLRHKLTCGSFTAAEELAVIGAKTAAAFDAAVDAMNGANA